MNIIRDIISGRRLAWYFNKVLSSSESADKSITHAIFERFNPNSQPAQQTEPTFEQEMMWKTWRVLQGSSSNIVHWN